MFDKEAIVDIQNLLSTGYIFYAHTSEITNENSNETLQEHTNRCINHFFSIVKARDLQVVFKNLEGKWFSTGENKYSEFFYELILNTITFHDLGKINPLFQKMIMKNETFLYEPGNLSLGSEHSIISAILYLEYFLPKCRDFTKDIKKFFTLLTYINAYVISKHHGNLDNFEKFLNAFYEDDGKNRYNAEIIRNEYKKYFNPNITFLEGKNSERYVKYILEYEASGKEASIYLYTYEKLIYSLLVASDYYAATEYRSKFTITYHGTIEDIYKLRKVYDNTDINQSIKKYRETCFLSKNKELYNVKDINILRSELYLESEEELLKNLDENMFYLEAPTGSGKSNVAFNLSFKLIEYGKNINKIMYIYPFNTLVDQNLDTIEKIFGHDKDIISCISVVNSVIPILQGDDDNNSFETYERALLDRQFFNYPITLSTHVSLFDIMFGNNKESGFAFYQLANSVIVLDEIQSYKNTIWTEIITFLKSFANVLNIKIIIMSATLPNLDMLSDEQNSAVKLILNRDKYFLHPLFKNRVVLDYSLINSTDIINDLRNKIIELLLLGKKVLIEFIMKKSAIEFYKNLITDTTIRNKNFKVDLITGDDSNAERARILNELEVINEETPFLLISTQVIEAGVDLKNIDIGFKDISKLDSEEQFMGRVNRSCKKEGLVYFFDYDNAKMIYKDDVRINNELTLKHETMREILREKNFNEYYTKVLEMIKSQNKSYATNKNIDEFFLHVGKLNIPIINKRMQLIDSDEWNCYVFLNNIIDLGNGVKLDGAKIWNDYKEILLNKSNHNYAEWRIKLSMVKSKMNYFIYQVNRSSTFPYTEQFGEIFYIENANQYFENGKFMREKLEKQIGTFI